MKRFTLADLPANAQAEALRQLHPHIGHAAFYPYPDSENGPRSGVQEREAIVSRAVDNPPRKAKVDGGRGPFYRITITLLTSDERDRDADGATSTLLDTYLFALGRLLGVDRVSLRRLAKGEERRRRGNHKH